MSQQPSPSKTANTAYPGFQQLGSKNRTWWTLTCNFGNIQPLDFDKSAIRRRMMPALDLKERKGLAQKLAAIRAKSMDYFQ
ncbi:hypothetical protein ANCDUO_23399 [Ancylostoma duodenale]|uniref:Uncharacterized protein n=1 Tax=Ancylostoma duodenale TaxID=51022 RepID=A0A0C2BRU1_9BILA|nr:hypothetical protein ANCDUO_23399 [Ancylostoma duodenale]